MVLPFRSLLLLLLACCSTWSQGQVLHGVLHEAPKDGRHIRLEAARGSDHVPVDSVQVAKDGSFSFRLALPDAGFYQLVVNDTDRVDLILDPREPEVALQFDGVPLQRHIRVLRSDENRRLWAYKLISKEMRAVQVSVAQERATADPSDHRRNQQLDSILQRAQGPKQAYLSDLLQNARSSYFAKVVAADRTLDTLIGKGPIAVVKAVDLSDPELMHCAVYDRAVMVFLQNVQVVSEGQLVVAADTLIGRASRNEGTKAYMIEHLLDLFSTYGPELAAAHVVDRYLLPSGNLDELPAPLREKVSEHLRVGVGSIGDDVLLVNADGAKPLSTWMAGAQRVVLFFYSSTCDHCHAQMPVLKELAARYGAQGLRVFGIALDTDRAEFEHAIAANALPWPSFSELNGWGAKTAKAYHVKATPSLFLLDAERRILAKPVDAEELQRILAH